MSTSQASLLNIPHYMIVALSFPKGQGSPSSTQIIMSNCELDRTYIIQSHQQFNKGDNTIMRQLSVMVRPSNHNVQSLGISWTIFFGNFHSIILMDAGHSVEDLWLKSPLCSSPSHKEAGSRMGGGCAWTLSQGSVRELFWASWLHCYIQFFYGHVFSIGGTVSSLRRKYTQGHLQCRDWRYTNDSLIFISILFSVFIMTIFQGYVFYSFFI